MDRKIDLELVDILETTCLKAFEVSGRLLKENPPVDVAALTPSSEDSAFEDRKTTSPILVAHTMVTQLMGAFDFMEKKGEATQRTAHSARQEGLSNTTRFARMFFVDIPSQLQTVLSNPHFLESLMSIVFNERYPTLLRQRAGDFLTLGKTANTVESIIGDDTLLSSIVDLASRCTHVANYPILEQIVSFLHIVYKKCNAKKRKGEAEQIHKAIQVRGSRQRCFIMLVANSSLVASSAARPPSTTPSQGFRTSISFTTRFATRSSRTSRCSPSASTTPTRPHLTRSGSARARSSPSCSR